MFPVNRDFGEVDVWDVSFALHEEGHIDPVYGRTVNNNLAESIVRYHV